MLFDRIALENHSYVATRAERIRNSEHWILKLNQDGAQQQLINDPTLLKRKENAKDYTTNAAELHGRTAETANIGFAIRQIP